MGAVADAEVVGVKNKKNMSKKTSLADRMKSYESCYETKIPERSYIIIRLDGKNFSKYTKMFEKPFDDILSNVMDVATIELCSKLHPKFAYTQSDEISLLFTTIDNIDAETPFEGKVQKLCSISASILTAAFNKNMLKLLSTFKYEPNEFIHKIQTGTLEEINATFDSRVFVIPDYREVANYFVWRQQDCTRNSVSMAASAYFSDAQTRNKSGAEKQEMLFQEKGINWNDYKVKYRRGVVISKQPVFVDVPAGHSGLSKKGTGPRAENPDEPITVMRSKWLPDYNIPVFTQDRAYIEALIPSYSEE